jgi:hypothetical protein
MPFDDRGQVLDCVLVVFVCHVLEKGQGYRGDALRLFSWNYR